MGYKWKPSAAQKKAFKEKMNNDAEYAASYEARKEAKRKKRTAKSEYDYSTAGGYFAPTEEQARAAWEIINAGTRSESDIISAKIIVGAIATGEKVYHDHIHRINEYRRGF